MRAENTFWPVGHTWRSAYGGTARIDYICVDLELPDVRIAVMSPPGVDLSLDAGEDHLCVAAWFQVVADAGTARGRPAFRVNTWKLQDPAMVAAACSRLRRYRLPLQGTVDDELEHFLEAAKAAPRVHAWVASRLPAPAVDPACRLGVH